MSEERFIDFYEILQVSQNADLETIERVFRLLAKRYHPDNTRTGDSERFNALSEAYHVLSDPEERASYDAGYESDKKQQWSMFLEAPLSGEDEDQRTLRWIMSLLYKMRRRGSKEPGMGIFELENYLEVAEGQLDYHTWYLKEKGWIMRTESGKFAITADGVDWIIGKDQVLRKDRLIGDGTSQESSGDSSASKEGGERIFPPHPEPPSEADSAEESNPSSIEEPAADPDPDLGEPPLTAEPAG